MAQPRGAFALWPAGRPANALPPQGAFAPLILGGPVQPAVGAFDLNPVPQPDIHEKAKEEGPRRRAPGDEAGGKRRRRKTRKGRKGRRVTRRRRV